MIYTPEVTTEEFVIDADHNSDKMASLIKHVAPDVDVLRIEEDVTAGWSGVSDCCSNDTISININTAFTKWVQEKLYQYRNLRYLRYGHLGGSANCNNSTGSWPDNRRSCRGSATVKAYIELVKL